MFFQLSCLQVGIKPLELLLWIRTRWASLYKFLVRLILLRLVCFYSKPRILLTVSNRVLINLFSLLMGARVFLIFLEVEAMLTSS